MMSTEIKEKTISQIKWLENLQRVNELFPDLKENKDRWGSVYYSSAKMNGEANEVEFRHSCGCCSDASLLAYFYRVVHGIKVYADPYCIYIGNQYELGSGDIPDADWRSVLRKHRIPEHLNTKVEEYFANHPPKSIDAVLND